MTNKRMRFEMNNHPMDIDPESPVFHGLIRGTLPWMLLDILQKEGPVHALGLVKVIQARAHGLWKPSTGSVYPILHRFEKQGLALSEWQETKAAPRRVYRLTEKGIDEVPKARHRLINEFRNAKLIIEMHIHVLEAEAADEGNSKDE